MPLNLDAMTDFDGSIEGPVASALSSDRVEALLRQLCVELGFCLSFEEAGKLIDAPPDSVSAFVTAVYAAERIDPETADRRVFGKVRDMVAQAFAFRMPHL